MFSKDLLIYCNTDLCLKDINKLLNKYLCISFIIQLNIKSIVTDIVL